MKNNKKYILINLNTNRIVGVAIYSGKIIALKISKNNKEIEEVLNYILKSIARKGDYKVSISTKEDLLLVKGASTTFFDWLKQDLFRSLSINISQVIEDN